MRRYQIQKEITERAKQQAEACSNCENRNVIRARKLANKNIALASLENRLLREIKKLKRKNESREKKIKQLEKYPEWYKHYKQETEKWKEQTSMARKKRNEYKLEIEKLNAKLEGLESLLETIQLKAVEKPAEETVTIAAPVTTDTTVTPQPAEPQEPQEIEHSETEYAKLNAKEKDTYNFVILKPEREFSRQEAQDHIRRSKGTTLRAINGLIAKGILAQTRFDDGIQYYKLAKKVKI